MFDAERISLMLAKDNKHCRSPCVESENEEILF